jgi:hypothetical protein
MTKKPKVKTVEICTDLHGLEYLNNVMTGEEMGYSRRTQKLKKISCGQRLAFLTEEDKIMALQLANNFDVVFDIKDISHEGNIPAGQTDNPTSRKTFWNV